MDMYYGPGWEESTNSLQMPVFPKLICILNAISIKVCSHKSMDDVKVDYLECK